MKQVNYVRPGVLNRGKIYKNLQVNSIRFMATLIFKRKFQLAPIKTILEE